MTLRTNIDVFSELIDIEPFVSSSKFFCPLKKLYREQVSTFSSRYKNSKRQNFLLELTPITTSFYCYRALRPSKGRSIDFLKKIIPRPDNLGRFINHIGINKLGAELRCILPQIAQIHTNEICATQRNLSAGKAGLWQKK
jgi:hypothetical protein